MAKPCNTNYYDYVSECQDYDIIPTTTRTTTTITTIEPSDDGDFNHWTWMGPILGILCLTAAGLTVRYAQRIRLRFSYLWRRFMNTVDLLIVRFNEALERRRRQDDIEARPRPWMPVPTATPPPGYDSVVAGSDNRYESHDLDSNQDSFPLESLSQASTPPTPPSGRYLNDRTIFHGRTSSEISDEVSQMIQRMFAANESWVSSERDLSSPNPERRTSSVNNGTDRIETTMDISSINSFGSFESAKASVEETPEQPVPARGLQPRSTRNPNPKYR